MVIPIYKLGVIIDYEVRSWAPATNRKQEDVKVNLLNAKSEQHLICDCSKNNECSEEKEILTSSWSFVLE